ncbi:S-adenosylmethionine decarboxylase proenzyme [Ascosphaera apis ARSEF 7405]|uniref:S-adenosylmethionine decarboxylase proenzyme n=1 Tax=Ascosphaera apis ARSEF 7405 TaxID=392613 RepID=A0A168BBJ1_9EURO|nr:S-adenosylmethionine decarboxylase proenzyme [Ascosphaera apis ARSEF 7405]
MVNIEIPRKFDKYLASSFEGIPSLTINHDATINLDSTNAFEGPEKLLEVWFASSPREMNSIQPNGLKSVPVEIWTEMLDLVSCKILSVVSSPDVDAYLLSESSMFVWPHKLILKTCGTTTLLLGLPRILQIATQYAGFPGYVSPNSSSSLVLASPYRVFYSRKNYLFPDRQKGPHRSWADEVMTLDRYFLDGSAYLIGKMNGEHWYLYVTVPRMMLTPPASPPSERILDGMDGDAVTAHGCRGSHGGCAGLIGGGGGDPQCERKDETLEILMTDLDEENAKQFYLDHASAVAKNRYRYLVRGKEDASFNKVLNLCHTNGFTKFGNGSDSGSDYYVDDDDDDGKEDCDSIPPELTTEGHALGTVVAETSGLLDIYPPSKYPDARVDAYLFTPCGFSANGVVPAPDAKESGAGTHYFTVHVTPEPHCSYASFETNVPQGQNGRETHDIIQHVVSIFKPGRFTVTFFEAANSADMPTSGAGCRCCCGGCCDGGEFCGEDAAEVEYEMYRRRAKARNAKMDRIPGYHRTDRIVHDLEGYDLVFRHYERDDFVGGGPRIGEGMWN